MRDLAMNCTVKLIGYRKSRTDGMVVSFSIHPNEVPDKLQTDPIGTSYMMALVEVDDGTGQPKEVMPTESKSKRTDTAPRPLTDKPAGGAHKSWDELSPAQQAGILCADQAFITFLNEKYGGIQNKDDATDLVHRYCAVGSRRDLGGNAAALEQWRHLVSRYRTWQHEPELVG